MRFLAFIILSIVSVAAQSHPPGIQWQSEGAARRKPGCTVLFFSKSPACAPCTIEERYFFDADFIAFASHFNAVYVNRDDATFARYQVDRWPTVVVVGPEGAMFKHVGLLSKADLKAWISSVIKHYLVANPNSAEPAPPKALAAVDSAGSGAHDGLICGPNGCYKAPQRRTPIGIRIGIREFQ